MIARNKVTMGIGSGNTSRVDSVNFAIQNQKELILKIKKFFIRFSYGF